MFKTWATKHTNVEGLSLAQFFFTSQGHMASAQNQRQGIIHWCNIFTICNNEILQRQTFILHGNLSEKDSDLIAT